MHLRGKAMSMEAILPDGTREMLTYVDHFNFNWMINYVYADNAAPVLPAGTVLHITPGMTIPPPTRTIPIPTNGLVGASARSTRCRTRGSM